jgi:hypothetical protein
MARGNCIVVSTDPKGRWSEGYIGTGLTPKPGTIMQIDHSVALKGGRHTFVLYNADADGGRPKGAIFVLRENYLLGRPPTEAYAAGDRAFFYTPAPSDELNLLVANLAGTADDHSAGEMLIIDDTTGLMIATTGTPETEVAQLNEDITDPTADTLAWCTWTGYVFWWLLGVASMVASMVGGGVGI